MRDRRHKTALTILFALVGLLLLCLIFVRGFGPDSLTRYQQALLARGEILSVTNLQSSLPDEDNGAPEVYEAIQQLKEGTVLPNDYPPCMRTTPPGRAVVGFREPEWVESGRTCRWEQVAAELKANEVTLASLSVALAKPGFDNKLDFSAGPEVGAQHLSGPNTLTRWLGAGALLALREGRLHDAAAALLAQIRLHRLLEGDRLYVSQMVRMTHAALARMTTREALQADAWTDADLAALQSAW